MKLVPAFKDYLWGGTKLVSEFHKQTDLRPVAESWEISCHPDGLSRIDGGKYSGSTLAEVLGNHPQYIGGEHTALPILVKLIDAQQALSVQVHPGDNYAWEHEGESGKNEMWYVVAAEEGAELIVGFQQEATPGELAERIAGNTLLDIVNRIPVKAGDCFAIPAGMLHAIGAGVLVAEVQQSSNTTYRVYDYNRKDAKGKTRELHIEKAIAVIDTTLQPEKLSDHPTTTIAGGERTQLTDWAYFSTAVITCFSKVEDIATPQSFHGILLLEGSFTLTAANRTMILHKGDSDFLPAGIGTYTLEGNGKYLRASLT